MTVVAEHPDAIAATAAPAPSEPAAGEPFAAVEITGTVRSVRTLPDADGWSIVSLDGDADSQDRHARRARTAVGTLDEGEEPLRQGCAYRFFGRWVHHDRHGDQFRFDGFAIADKQTQMGIIAFLTRSDLGLTKGDATAAWKLYGTDAINMIRECPSDVVVELESDADQHTRIYDASRGLIKTCDMDKQNKSLLDLIAERDRLLAAIKEHHAQKADDRCFMDDDRLYAAASLPPCDRRVGDKVAMLANCVRFIDRRCASGKWASYVELEQLIRRLLRLMLTCSERNKPGWMRHLAERINEACEVIGEADRFEYDPRRPDKDIQLVRVDAEVTR